MDAQVDEIHIARDRRSRFMTLLLWGVRALLPVALLAGAYFGYNYFVATRPEVVQHPAQERVWAVSTVAAAYTSQQPVLTLYGETVAGRRVEMKSQVAGEVVGVGPGLRDGGEVSAGDFLFEIDSFEYQGALDEARANLRESMARLSEFETRAGLERDALARAGEQLELARRDLARAQQLRENATLSEKTVDDRALVVSQREQSVEQRQSNQQIEQARADQQRAVQARLEWRVRRAERDLAYTRITAPFDAYVSGAGVEIGRTLSINDVAATLLDSNWVEVRVTLSDRQYGRIIAQEGSVIGRPVKIRWDVGAAPLEYTGRIERVAAEINAASGGVEVYARVLFEAGDRPLRAGAFVEVDVSDLNYANVVRLPATALYDQDSVYAVIDDRLEKRDVEIIGFDGGDLLLRGTIAEGEQIVVTRLSEIGEGIKVREIDQ